MKENNVIFILLINLFPIAGWCTCAFVIPIIMLKNGLLVNWT